MVSDPPPLAAADPPAHSPSLGLAEAISTLFPEGLPATVASACPGGPADERARCLVRARFEGSPGDADRALGMLERGGHVAGVEREWVMEGGFRGTIQIVPELPVARHARHLEWVAAAMDDFSEFFEGLAARAPRPLSYRWRALAFRFFRSVGRTTPSAYASDWTVAYNVSGSLHRSADKVRETLFHELFHLNDQAHGDWTRSNLARPFDEIVARCGTNRACLAPWAPSQTTVRGGTYYAFQPDNGEGFHEYGAELALRYYREQRTALNGRRVAGPFKCGPDPNRRVWSLLAQEFFGGADLVPDC
ncbi:MAG: hypothetical protein HYY06_31330 [Deltaproteobacteria bacterium]|nr:hypothetical protein [Deltaproteobacteria bacterium]